MFIFARSISSQPHGNQESVHKKLKVDNKIKLRCSNRHEKKRLREIFDDECELNPDVGINMQYAKRKRCLSMHKSKGIPKNPKTISEVKEYFDKPEILSKFGMTLHQTPKIFYQEIVITASFAYVIFCSESIISDLPLVRRTKIDGTFKSVRCGPFKQLLIIATDFANHVSISKPENFFQTVNVSHNF